MYPEEHQESGEIKKKDVNVLESKEKPDLNNVMTQPYEFEDK